MGTTTLAPGAETALSMALMMHAGMEGPHLFRITVPVAAPPAAGGELALYVRADFP